MKGYIKMIAKYNEDNSCVDVYVSEYAKKPKISIHTGLIEESLNATPYAYSQLQKLLDDSPLEYAEMVLNDTIGDYVALCNSEYAEQTETLKIQLSSHYEDMSETQINSLVKEFMMYDN